MTMRSSQIEMPLDSAPWRTQTRPTFPGGGIQPNGMPSGQVPGMPFNPTMPTSNMNINANLVQSNKNSFLNSLMSPEAIAGMAMGGLGFASNYLSNRSANQNSQADRDLRMKELLAGISGDELTDMRARQQAYLGSTQMDPVSQSRDLFSANLLRDIAAGGPGHVTPGQGNTNPAHVSDATMGFLSPGALAENASRFYGAAGAIDPHQAHPDLASMGFGDAAGKYQGQMDTTITDAGARYDALNKSRRDALLGSINTGQDGGDVTNAQGTTLHNPDPSRYQWDPAKKTWVPIQHGSKLGTIGRIAGMVAPFALMAVPGLQGAGIGMMAARAGASAGIGALTSRMQGASAGQSLRNGAIGGAMTAGNDYFNRRPGPATTRQGGTF